MSEQPLNIRIAAFFATYIGRGARIAIGLGLIALGAVIGGITGLIVGIIGLAPLAMGVTNRCIISKAIGAPWKGQDATDLVDVPA